MTGADILVATASIGLLAVAVSAAAVLKAWQGWLDLRRAGTGGQAKRRTSTETRIEIVRLRERVRRLEAIANGSDI